MKKRVSQILSLVLVAALTLTLFACSKKDDPGDTTQESSTVIETTEEVPETEASSESTEPQQPTETAEKPAPSTTAEIVALYNSAVQKNGTLQASTNKRTLQKGQILGSGALEGKTFELTEDENAKKIIEKDGANQPMTLSTVGAGSVAKASCTEQDGKYNVTLNLNQYKGSQPTAEAGYAGFISYDECASLAQEIAALFNLKAKVGGADITLNEGMITAVIDKESGKLLSVTASYNQVMDVKLSVSVFNVSANIVCKNEISLAA